MEINEIFYHYKVKYQEGIPFKMEIYLCSGFSWCLKLTRWQPKHMMMFRNMFKKSQHLQQLFIWHRKVIDTKETYKS